MREKSAEQPRAPTRPVTLDPRRQAPVVVVENRQRDRAEERECVQVPVDPCLGHRRRVCPNVRCVAVRKVKGEEMDLLLGPADERPPFAEIGLCVPRRVLKRHVHLPAPAMMLANMVLHDRVPAGEPVLVAKTLEDALRGVPLLAVNTRCGQVMTKSPVSYISRRSLLSALCWRNGKTCLPQSDFYAELSSRIPHCRHWLDPGSSGRIQSLIEPLSFHIRVRYHSQPLPEDVGTDRASSQYSSISCSSS